MRIRDCIPLLFILYLPMAMTCGFSDAISDGDFDRLDDIPAHHPPIPASIRAKIGKGNSFSGGRMMESNEQVKQQVSLLEFAGIVFGTFIWNIFVKTGLIFVAIAYFGLMHLLKWNRDRNHVKQMNWLRDRETIARAHGLLRRDSRVALKSKRSHSQIEMDKHL